MKGKKYLPQSVAGLLSYYEEKGAIIKVKPETALAIIGGIPAVVFLLQLVWR